MSWLLAGLMLCLVQGGGVVLPRGLPHPTSITARDQAVHAGATSVALPLVVDLGIFVFSPLHYLCSK